MCWPPLLTAAITTRRILCAASAAAASRCPSFGSATTRLDTTLFKYIIPGMQQVVDGRGGTGDFASLAQYGISVAGKTGTVQNAHGLDHSTFAAFAPANNPKIAIAVFIENLGFGGTFAAPAAGLMMEKYLRGKVSPTASAGKTG
ncbi:MAG: penicillin-binding transpeptidase domain-containing protein [Hymenobacter sp.]